MITTPIKQWRDQDNIASLCGAQGSLLHFTLIRVAAKGFMKESPYPVVIVRMENGRNIIGQMVDWTKEDLVIGKKVVAVVRRINPEDSESIVPYYIKFRPL